MDPAETTLWVIRVILGWPPVRSSSDNDQTGDPPRRSKRAIFDQSAAQQNRSLFNYFVGTDQDGLGNCESKRFGGLEIDAEQVLRRLLHW
jgi:hypothetical protein